MTTFVDLQQLSAAELNSNLPQVGGAMAYGGSVSPDVNWMIMAGDILSRADYALLFSRIGTAFGAGDGVTTFQIPDGRGRAIFGVGAPVWATIFAHTAVDTGANTIAVASNKALYTGVKVRVSTAGTLPSPLVAATDYYVVRISATSIKLATSRQNALGSTTTTGASSTPSVIDITTQGSGSITLTIQDYESIALGEYGGEQKHGQTIEELVAHAHIQMANDGNSSGSGGSPEDDDNPTESTGGSTPAPVLNPFVGMNWLMKVK